MDKEGRNVIIKTREENIELTQEWKGERLEDGRPKVPVVYLDKLITMTLEEIFREIIFSMKI